MRDLQARKEIDDLSRKLRVQERSTELLSDRLNETEARLEALFKHLKVETTRADIVIVSTEI